MAHPSISTADSYWLSGGGYTVLHRIVVQWDGQGVYHSHISLLQRWKNIPGLQRWTQSQSLTPSLRTLSPPTQDCELIAFCPSHTHKWGASVTADCDHNGWKLLLPPFLSHTVYRCVPPSLFHSLWRFYLCQARVKPHMGASFSLLSAVFLYHFSYF